MNANPLPRTLLVGFIAGAIAVATAHQFTVLVLNALGLIGGGPYSMRPIPPLGVPQILNQMFWGGLWGVVFAALVADRVPRTLPTWLAGLLFGWIGPAIIGGWLLVPAIKGLPLANGFVPGRMWPSLVINGTFGIAVAYLVPFLRERMGGARPALSR